MRIKKWVVLGFVLAFVLTPLLRAQTAEQSEEINRHKALVVSYQQKAETQQGIIDEHEQMKAQALKDGTFNAKVGPSLDYRAMERHCDALIKSATEAKTELLEFAKYHQQRTAELQGQ